MQPYGDTMNAKETVDRIVAAVAAKRRQGIVPPSFYEVKGPDFSGLETFWIFLNEFRESLDNDLGRVGVEADALLAAMLERAGKKVENSC